MQRSVTCFTEFADTRTYLPSPNFLMTYFEAKYHAVRVETPKNEAMKGGKIVTAPRSQVMKKNCTQKNFNSGFFFGFANLFKQLKKMLGLARNENKRGCTISSGYTPLTKNVRDGLNSG